MEEGSPLYLKKVVEPSRTGGSMCGGGIMTSGVWRKLMRRGSSGGAMTLQVGCGESCCRELS